MLEEEAQEIAADGFAPAEKFIRHAIIRAVGNVKNQGGNLIEPIDIQSNTI
jgi:hypothetical protein